VVQRLFNAAEDDDVNSGQVMGIPSGEPHLFTMPQVQPEQLKSYQIARALSSHRRNSAGERVVRLVVNSSAEHDITEGGPPVTTRKAGAGVMMGVLSLHRAWG